MITGMVIITLISLGGLLYAGYHNWKTSAVVIKTITSLCFVLLGIMAYKENSNRYGICMLAGLVCGALGDILLGISNQDISKQEQWFLGGVGAFSVAHIAFAGAFIKESPQILSTLLVIPIIIVVIFIMVTSNQYFDFGQYRRYVIGYSIIISIMLTAAINLGTTGQISDMKLNRALVGATLFVLSDIILCVHYFYYKKLKWTVALNLITYYVAEICLALSILY